MPASGKKGQSATLLPACSPSMAEMVDFFSAKGRGKGSGIGTDVGVDGICVDLFEDSVSADGQLPPQAQKRLSMSAPMSVSVAKLHCYSPAATAATSGRTLMDITNTDHARATRPTCTNTTPETHRRAATKVITRVGRFEITEFASPVSQNSDSVNSSSVDFL